MDVYKECKNCIAIPFCKVYNNVITLDRVQEFCTPKYKLDVALKLSGLPKTRLKNTMYNYTATDKNLFTQIEYLVNNIERFVQEGRNAFFFGEGTGTGKTFSACTLLNHYIYRASQYKDFDYENPVGMFIGFPDLMEKLRYEHDDDLTKDIITKISTTPLLVLDDVGASKMSEFVEEQMYIIINRRVEGGHSTIVTSNLDTKKFKEHTNARITSRILSNCTACTFSGVDRRTNKI